jgi:hypothetical protein
LRVEAALVFKAGMRRLQRIGEQLVVLPRCYQEAMARQGGLRWVARPWPLAKSELQ